MAALEGARYIDVEGESHQIGVANNKAVPFTVILAATPGKRFDDPNEIARYIGTNVASYIVLSDPSIDWREAQAIVQDFNSGAPLILDANLSLFERLKSVDVPSILEFDAQGVISNKTALSYTSSENTDSTIEDRLVTYNRDIAPILAANCVACHRPQGIAPFSLDNYEAAKRFAPVIAYATENKIMPPWSAGHESPFLNERTLTAHEIGLLQKWSDQGAVLGNNENQPPEPQTTNSNWPLGEPDIIISMPAEYSVPANGPDIYRYFVVPDAIPKNLEIAAIDFLPGDASVVHHANFFVDYGGVARKKDQASDETGFSVFGTGGLFSYWDENTTAAGLGAWAPGANPVKYEDGLGIKLPGGADFVFEIHYHPTGKPAKDRSQVGIYLSKKPIKTEVSSLFMGTNEVHVPAGVKGYQRHFWMEFPAKMQLIDIAPHMHYLGTKAQVIATLPDGSEKTLLKSRWDFRWQNSYRFRQPVSLPKGTRIDAVFEYDNSADNPYNPFNPPVDASWGWGSDQEMGELYLTVVADSNRQLAKLQRAAQESWYRSSDPQMVINPPAVEQLIDELLTTSIWSVRGNSVLRSLSSDQGRFDQSLRYLKTKIKASPQAVTSKLRTIQGALYGLASYDSPSYINKWYNSHSKALSIDHNNWDSHYSLAKGYAESGERKYLYEAKKHFETLLGLQKNLPVLASQHSDFYTSYGDLLTELGEAKRAKEIFHLGLEAFPDSPRLKEKLEIN